MKRINDPVLMDKFKRQYNVDAVFGDHALPFRRLQFEKGEILTGLQDDPQWLLFNLGGRIKLYAVQEGGDLAPMHLGDHQFSCVNPLELLGKKNPARKENQEE